MLLPSLNSLLWYQPKQMAIYLCGKHQNKLGERQCWFSWLHKAFILKCCTLIKIMGYPVGVPSLISVAHTTPLSCHLCIVTWHCWMPRVGFVKFRVWTLQKLLCRETSRPRQLQNNWHTSPEGGQRLECLEGCFGSDTCALNQWSTGSSYAD